MQLLRFAMLRIVLLCILQWSCSGLSPLCVGIPGRLSSCAATVNSTCYSGLQEAMNAARDGPPVLLWESIKIHRTVTHANNIADVNSPVHVVGCIEGVGITCAAGSGTALVFDRGFGVAMRSTVTLEGFGVYGCEDAAVDIQADDIKLKDMTFDGNARNPLPSKLEGTYTFRAAVTLTTSHDCHITNCLFLNNGRHSYELNGYEGLGALYHSRHVDVLGEQKINHICEDSEFTNNTGTWGGAMNLNAAGWSIRRSEFHANTAKFGGAILSRKNIIVEESLFFLNSGLDWFNSTGYVFTL